MIRGDEVLPISARRNWDASEAEEEAASAALDGKARPVLQWKVNYNSSGDLKTFDSIDDIENVVVGIGAVATAFVAAAYDVDGTTTGSGKAELVGTMVAPSVSVMGNSFGGLTATNGDKFCNIYRCGGDGKDRKSTLAVLCHMPDLSDEDAVLLADSIILKLGEGEQAASEMKRVVIYTAVDKLQVSATELPGSCKCLVTEAWESRPFLRREKGQDIKGHSDHTSLPPFLPVGSMLGGFAAALLSKCQTANLAAALFVTLHEPPVEVHEAWAGWIGPHEHVFGLSTAPSFQSVGNNAGGGVMTSNTHV